MRTALLVVLLSFAPVAAAGPETLCSAGLVCVAEGSAGDDCADFGGGATNVVVAGTVGAGGSYYCHPGGGENAVYVQTPAEGVYWGEVYYSDPENGDFRSCFIFVGPAYSPLPCDVAGPPNPGWGNVLP